MDYISTNVHDVKNVRITDEKILPETGSMARDIIITTKNSEYMITVFSEKNIPVQQEY